MQKVQKVLYVSGLYSQRLENELLRADQKLVGQQIQKYHRLLVKGLLKNKVQVCSMSSLPFSENVIINRREENEDGIRYHYISCRAGSRLKHFSVFCQSFCDTSRFLKDNESSAVICDVLNLSLSLGAVLAAGLRRRKAIGIITDLPEQMFGKESIGSRISWLIVSRCSGYVVLTKYMAERMDPRKKCLVLEGHIDSDISRIENTLENKVHPRICMYAGMLHQKYGIDLLIQAFRQAAIPDAELQLFGTGDYLEEIGNLQDPSIKYCGVLSNQEIVKREISATLLINPRPSSEMFTLYSFPSKNLEYMASGTPLLTTELPGMPEEHKKYVYLFPDETVDGMAEALRRVLSLPEKELFEMGKRARDYLLENTTEVVQARKISEMIFELQDGNDA